MSRKKCVLVVVAHADDLEFMAGGTIARFVEEKGYPVYEYILTDNSRGSHRISGQELIRVSAKEATEAGKVLGLAEVRLEGYTDGLLNEENSNVVQGKIIAFIREIQADIVMSWDPFAPDEDHPDHRVTAMATLEAAGFAGMPLFYPEHEHAPHVVTEAYWFAKSPQNAGLFVDISTTIGKKIEALLKHDCQMQLTIDGLVQEAKALGAELPGLQDLPAEGYREVIADGIRSFCAAAGKQAGFEFAEQFRYQKLGMLDQVLGTNYVQPDF